MTAFQKVKSNPDSLFLAPLHYYIQIPLEFIGDPIQIPYSILSLILDPLSLIRSLPLFLCCCCFTISCSFCIFGFIEWMVKGAIRKGQSAERLPVKTRQYWSEYVPLRKSKITFKPFLDVAIYQVSRKSICEGAAKNCQEHVFNTCFVKFNQTISPCSNKSSLKVGYNCSSIVSHVKYFTQSLSFE